MQTEPRCSYEASYCNTLWLAPRRPADFSQGLRAGAGLRDNAARPRHFSAQPSESFSPPERIHHPAARRATDSPGGQSWSSAPRTTLGYDRAGSFADLLGVARSIAPAGSRSKRKHESPQRLADPGWYSCACHSHATSRLRRHPSCPRRRSSGTARDPWRNPLRARVQRRQLSLRIPHGSRGMAARGRSDLETGRPFASWISRLGLAKSLHFPLPSPAAAACMVRGLVVMATRFGRNHCYMRVCSGGQRC
jgi:hypothetical protein